MMDNKNPSSKPGSQDSSMNSMYKDQDEWFSWMDVHPQGKIHDSRRKVQKLILFQLLHALLKVDLQKAKLANSPSSTEVIFMIKIYACFDQFFINIFFEGKTYFSCAPLEG